MLASFVFFEFQTCNKRKCFNVIYTLTGIIKMQ